MDTQCLNVEMLRGHSYACFTAAPYVDGSEATVLIRFLSVLIRDQNQLAFRSLVSTSEHHRQRH